MIENGWKLILPSIHRAMSVDAHYLCKCGNHDSFLLEEIKDDFPDYNCKQCSNNLFLSYESFINPKQPLISDNFNCLSRTFMNENGWNIAMAYKIPVYDYSQEVFKYKTYVAILITLSFSGDLIYEVFEKFIQVKRTYDFKVSSTLENHIKKTALGILSTYVIEHRPQQLAWITNEVLEEYRKDFSIRVLNIIQFFLQNSTMKDIECYFWKREGFEYLTEVSTATQALQKILGERQEKSVRRALFNYYNAHEQPKKYDPAFDYIILRTFTNPNYLVKLLSLPSFHKNNLFLDTDVITSLNVIHFFFNYYNENEIFQLFKQAMLNKNLYRLWSDCFRMLSNAQELVQYQENIQRQKAHVKLIHDELVRVQNYYIKPSDHDFLKPFEYSQYYLEAEGAYNGLYFKLPDSPEILQAWSQDLHNCMFSYRNSIADGRLVIYGVYKYNKLIYALELKGDKIHQAKANHNEAIPKHDRYIIDEWRKFCLSK